MFPPFIAFKYTRSITATVSYSTGIRFATYTTDVMGFYSMLCLLKVGRRITKGYYNEGTKATIITKKTNCAMR